MTPSDSSKANALIRSRSPYLLQHAYNPVDWMEWGDEAFERAEREDKAIFLSVGYSTCHWCHVMARESFENGRIAEYLNRHFVNVKLDREERPDVDRIYMSFVQSLTGSGGWPMSVWLLPDGQPFYGGTYFPPDDRYGRIGFEKLLIRIQELWTERRGELAEQATRFVEMLSSLPKSSGSEEFLSAGRDVALQVVGELRRSFDPEWGGFGNAPKFPMAANLQFLLAVMESEFDESEKRNASEMLSITLEKMALGGIYDFVGGGFHRYSVDRYWHVPHYEKMLYDQGQLLAVYAQAGRLFPQAGHERLIGDIVDYLKRDLTADQGGLFAAEDADSEAEDQPGAHAEGAFYVWTDEELKALLSAQEYSILRDAFAITKRGNSPPESDPHGELVGKNTLLRARSSEQLARKFDLTVPEIDSALAQARRKLFERRNQRPRPHLDDKIVAAWNAMAICGLCESYQSFGNEEALEIALSSGRFIRSNMYDEEGKTLYRLFRGSRGEVGGFAEDYAHMILAAINLYESTFDVEWIHFGNALAEQLVARFEDPETGGFFASEEGDDRLIARLKDDYDGAEPCASSVAVLALMKLGRILDDANYAQVADRAIRAFEYQWSRASRAMPLMLAALMYRAAPSQEIVIVGDESDSDFQEAVKVAYRLRSRRSVLVALGNNDSTNQWLIERNQSLGSKLDSRERLKVYVCEDYVCSAPLASSSELGSLLENQ